LNIRSITKISPADYTKKGATKLLEALFAVSNAPAAAKIGILPFPINGKALVT
jgi:hypothetical protein